MLDAPSNLLRFFDSKEYALQFVSGQIRCGLLTYYKEIEGSRHDDKEGRSSFFWDHNDPQFQIDNRIGGLVGPTESNQKIRYRGSSMNPFYIISTSCPDVAKDTLIQKFGSFIIFISDPQVLLERIRVAWLRHSLALNDHVELVSVDYNKDELIPANKDLSPPARYVYSQKPASYSDEKEFRYVLTCRIDVNRDDEKYLTLDVGNCADICCLL